MKKAIVYSTTTGNTEIMAEAIAEGAKSSGAETVLQTADSADREQVLASDVIYLGSPAMGDEVLDDPMEDFFTGIERSISGKKIAIFGSYDWGDGQWLRDWADRISAAGATCVNGEGLKCNLTPDDAGVQACKELGAENFRFRQSAFIGGPYHDVLPALGRTGAGTHFFIQFATRGPEVPDIRSPRLE